MPQESRQRAARKDEPFRLADRSLQGTQPGGSMTKHIWTGLCATIVGFTTAALIAQTTSPPQSAASSASAERRIIVTGCLVQAPASVPETAATAAGATGAAGTAGAAGTTGTTGVAGAAGDAAPSPKFVLTNATSSVADTSATTGTAEAPPAAAATSQAQTYRLIANATALSPHVGKRIELTGTLEDAAASAHGADPSAGPQANAPALRVESGKVVAPSCSQ